MCQRFINLLLIIVIIVVISPLFTEAAIRSLTGYAWSSNIGWINFRGQNYVVNLDTTSVFFSGDAWSPNIG